MKAKPSLIPQRHFLALCHLRLELIERLKKEGPGMSIFVRRILLSSLCKTCQLLDKPVPVFDFEDKEEESRIIYEFVARTLKVFRKRFRDPIQYTSPVWYGEHEEKWVIMARTTDVYKQCANKDDLFNQPFSAIDFKKFLIKEGLASNQVFEKTINRVRCARLTALDSDLVDEFIKNHAK